MRKPTAKEDFEPTAQYVAEMAKIPLKRRPEFCRTLWLLTLQIHNSEGRRKAKGGSAVQLYSGDVIRALNAVAETARELLSLLDLNPVPLTTPGMPLTPDDEREASARSAAIVMLLPSIGPKGLPVDELENVVAAVAEARERVPEIFPKTGRPKGVSRKPTFDPFLAQLQQIARECGGSLGIGYPNDPDRETSGTLEPAVNALRDHLPSGFVPKKVWADAARGRRRPSKKSPR